MDYDRKIVFSREDMDFGMYLNGELIGFARTHHEAQVQLDRIVYDRLQRDGRNLAPAAQLYAIYQQDAQAFWREIASFSDEQRSEYAVLFAIYATIALNRPTTSERVLARWAIGHRQEAA